MSFFEHLRCFESLPFIYLTSRTGAANFCVDQIVVILGSGDHMESVQAAQVCTAVRKHSETTGK